MSKPAKHIGEVIQRLRTDAGLMRSEVGALANMADTTIRNIETGSRRPTRKQLDCLLSVICIARPLAWVGLATLAEREGFSMDLMPEPPPDSGR